MRRLILLAALAASCALTPSLAQWRALDRGGDLAAYLRDVEASAGRRHEIRGDCMSACTLWLGAKGACVAQDAVLWFHAASDPIRAMRDNNPWRAISPLGNAVMLATYPPRVRAVVRPWLQSPAYRTLTGPELIALGVPACDAPASARASSG